MRELLKARVGGPCALMCYAAGVAASCRIWYRCRLSTVWMRPGRPRARASVVWLYRAQNAGYGTSQAQSDRLEFRDGRKEATVGLPQNPQNLC